MNKISLLVLAAFLALAAADQAYTQTKTIVLVRHAEKADNSADPELSAEGRDRALRLVKKVNRYKPKEIYSTNFKRTKDTVQPLAAKRRLQIQTYDARDQKALADKILASPNKRVLVSGHSNTVPGLANLLAKKELFRNLEDSEYGAIWVIRIKKGTLQKVEILSY